MLIGKKTILTPSDDPVGYDLTWRWQTAQAAMVIAAGGGRPPWMLIRDVDARTLIQHLQRRQRLPLKDGEKRTSFDRVTAWKESPAAALIEAYLIGADTLDVAAADLGLPVEEVALFGRVFLDVRNDAGKRRPAVLMRLQSELATQDDVDIATRLRKIALAGGVPGLRRVLHAGAPIEESSLDQLVEEELFRRLHAGELRTGDLVRLQSNAIARERVNLERKDEGQPKLLESLELVRHLLGLMAPRITQVDRTEDREAATNEAIRSRLAAQRNIGATAVTDEPDRGLAALDAMIAKQFMTGES